MNRNLVARLVMLLAALLILPATLTAQEFDKGPELDPEKDYYALMVTNKGNIALKLFPDKAPRTVQNFVNLAEGTAEFRDPRTTQKVKRPFYNGLTFHRVIPSFMIQGGCPMGTGTGSPGYRFQDEFVPDLNFTKPGLLAMANSGPNTNGSQFFITEVPTTHLNQKHTIFGEILEGTDGLDLVKAIARVPKGQRDAPLEKVVLERLQIFRFDKGTEVSEVREKVLAGEAESAATRPATQPSTRPAEPPAPPPAEPPVD